MSAGDVLFHSPGVGCSSSIEEEMPMTMQVGMVGSDGILLAGDTRWTYTPKLRPNELWSGKRYTQGIEKIVINRNRGMAVTCARNMEVARSLANLVIAEIRDEDCAAPIAALEAIGNKVLASCEEKRNDAQCLIAFMKPTPRYLSCNSERLTVGTVRFVKNCKSMGLPVTTSVHLCFG